MPLAPIVLFIYNRPDHTQKTLKALSENYLAKDSILYVYADGPKENVSKIEKKYINESRRIVLSEKWCKEIVLIESNVNKGLAASIIEGVTSIVNQYGKVIVLEDDIVTSPYFLTFMNNALDYYVDNLKVWHISGWNHPIKTSGLGDAFFWRTMDCWGWATWKDRWKYFEKDTDKLLEKFTKKDIYRFNINGAENLWGQVVANKKGKINTWAIFWYATIFQKNGLCLSPTLSFVQNIGFDGTGINCGEIQVYVNDNLCEKIVDFVSLKIEENCVAVRRIWLFYKILSIKKRLLWIYKKINFIKI
jgi:hypothetical protein